MSTGRKAADCIVLGVDFHLRCILKNPLQAVRHIVLRVGEMRLFPDPILADKGIPSHPIKRQSHHEPLVQGANLRICTARNQQNEGLSSTNYKRIDAATFA